MKALLALVLLGSFAAAAEVESEVRLAAGIEGDVLGSPKIAPHGFVLARGQVRGLFDDDKVFGIAFNTDSLELNIADPSAFGGALYTKLLVRAQAFAAQMSIDHVRAGRLDLGRVYGSSYILTEAFVARTLAANPRGKFELSLSAGARQWFHFPLGDVASGYRLPGPMTAAELRAALSVRPTRTGPFGRRDGAHFDLSGLGIARLGQSAFGDAGGPNDVDAPLGLRGRLEGGFSFRAERPRLAMVPVWAFSGRAGQGVSLDDRYRFLLGGENPWVEQVAGLGWAERVVDRFSVVHVEGGVEVADTVMFLAGADAAFFVDPRRDVPSARPFEGPDAALGGFVEVQTLAWEGVWVRLRGARAFGTEDIAPPAWKWLFHLEWTL